MAALSALRAGCGLVHLAIPAGLNPILQRRAFEAVTHPLPETPTGSIAVNSLGIIRALERQADAVCLGPGLSTHAGTRKLVHALLKELSQPLVIDADGLNNLAGRLELISRARSPVVLTPHPGEMSRLTGVSTKKVSRDRNGAARKLARQSGATVLLKGHRTVVASPAGPLYINHTGNPGMATAGSGDVLSGILGAFLAKGAPPFEAACWAAYIHGRAGDRAARALGKTALIARDLIEYLPQVFKSLE